jgi:copper chaperone CopZ
MYTTTYDRSHPKPTPARPGGEAAVADLGTLGWVDRTGGQLSDSEPTAEPLTVEPPTAQGDAMITVHVPAMSARADARAISSRISDVPGVQTLQADLATRTVQVTGSADPVAVTAAVTAAG